jgi:hypothetical protein
MKKVLNLKKKTLDEMLECPCMECFNPAKDTYGWHVKNCYQPCKEECECKWCQSERTKQ